MADNEYAYQLTKAPTGATDGSGQVHHDVFAVGREAGTTDPWLVVPNYHKTIVVPSSQIEAVMDMPDATGPQKNAKNQAYKQALVSHRDDPATPVHAPAVTDWSPSGIDAYLTAYDAWLAAKTIADAHAGLQATRVGTYITVTLGISFPVSFQV